MQAKPTTSPLQVARSRQAHGFSIKKKIQRMRNRTHHVASSLADRSNPITQYKSKPNTELSKPNTLTQRTEHRGVYQKKKKSPIHKPKPNPVTHGRSRRRRCCHSELVVVVVATVAPHRRSTLTS